MCLVLKSVIAFSLHTHCILRADSPIAAIGNNSISERARGRIVPSVPVRNEKTASSISGIQVLVFPSAVKYFDSKEYQFEGQTTIQGCSALFSPSCISSAAVQAYDHTTDIFEAVQSSAITCGVVPFENSTNGSVVYTLDLFCDRQNTYPDVNVCGEVYVGVHHNLLGHNDSHFSTSGSSQEPTTQLAPGLEHHSRFSGIRRIYSHPQAFGQCEIFLAQYLKHAERHEVSSTSKAAEIVSLDKTRTSAAISSAIAAEEHSLDILAPKIEDRADNTTRFLIIRKGNERPEPLTWGAVAGAPREENESGWEYKSLLSFTIDHQSPGALADALMVFKTHGLNLTSINSRPTQTAPWHYIFFVEFEGSEWGDPDGAVRGALKDLANKAKGWRWLGSWRDQLKGQERMDGIN
ncbi:hypothetical protein FGG08_002317 [Glutinoglossum americanum]|uniref:prephenate dehydratase n=1 Tax=Glutinoglossum americanum TaxID=1670608 RepID=A0A9P8ID40_9PEZI|nr:hypothetical protein FGG08_002317 [Glutinoglossum americanum]